MVKQADERDRGDIRPVQIIEAVANTAAMNRQIASATAHPEPDRTRIWGVLLYTDEDARLRNYVHKHFDSLSKMSGDILHIFVVDRSLSVAQHFRFLRHFPTFGAKSDDVHIADTLGVPYDALPCLVLFDPERSQERLVFRITTVSSAYFRRLFSVLRYTLQTLEVASDALQESLATHQLNKSSEAYALVRERYQTILEQIKAMPADTPRSLYGYSITVVVGDQVMGDKVLGDKVAQDKIIIAGSSGSADLPDGGTLPPLGLV